MKKNLLFIYLFLFLFLTCCVPENNNPVDFEPAITFTENEIYVSLDEKVTMPIDIIIYDIEEIDFIIQDPEILAIQFLNIIPLEVGITTITAVLKDNPAVSVSLKVYVENSLVLSPKVTTALPIMKVGQKTQLLFINQRNVGALKEFFDWNISDETVAVIEDDLTVKALKEGTTTITATLRSNPDISGSYELQVVSGEVYRDSGKPVIFIRPEENKFVVEAGDYLQIIIENNDDFTNDYYWRSINRLIAKVTEDGRVVGCVPGVTSIYVYSKTDNQLYGMMYVEVKGKPQVDYASRLISIAEGELGYREKADGYSKYGYWYGTIFGSYFTNLHWCAMFVTWCANETGIPNDIFPSYANVSNGKENFSHRGMYHLRENYTPKAGDIIFFLRDGAGHTGIVTDCDGERVYTIEGNTSNMVARRSYALDYRTIDGYGTPDYERYLP